jgi:glycosyltransferase involved in cell wall biosynthesis
VSVKKVSVVLPIHNQADHLQEVLDRLEEALSKLTVEREVILVPNACTDGSLEICEEFAASHEHVRVKETPRAGWGHAVKCGLAETTGDIVCYTNAARTTPEDLLLSLMYSVAYPDVVIKANRKIRESARRRLGSLLYNLECRALMDMSYWDINGTPKVFPRKFAKLLELSREDDLIDAEFCAICRDEDYPMLEVPILSFKRYGGRSTTTYFSALKMYVGAYDLWRQRRKSGVATSKGTS